MSNGLNAFIIRVVLASLILAISSNLLRAQENNYFLVDPIFWPIYKEAQVKKVKVYTYEYENGQLEEEYVEALMLFDKEGNLIREQEYYDSDTTEGWYIDYSYDDQHRLTKSLWDWRDPDDPLELTQHEYGANGKLSRTCDYHYYRGEEMELDSCYRFEYEGDKMMAVKTDDLLQNHETFVHQGDSAVRQPDGNIFYRGLLVRSRLDDEFYYYFRNEQGQIKRFEARDLNGQLLRVAETLFENGLIKEKTYKKANGELVSRDVYTYEYYDK